MIFNSLRPELIIYTTGSDPIAVFKNGIFETTNKSLIKILKETEGVSIKEEVVTANDGPVEKGE